MDWLQSYTIIRQAEQQAESAYRQAIADADAELLAELSHYANEYERTPAQADAAIQVTYANDRAMRLLATDTLHMARRQARVA